MSNGNGESRLDRIERSVERLALAQEAQREEFDREFKSLLRAQVVLTDRVDRLTIAQTETTDKLNALIDLMDRHLREGHHAPGPPQ
jgi:hypothetical protein